MNQSDEDLKSSADSQHSSPLRIRVNENTITKKIKETHQSAAKILRREFFEIKVYDKNNPQGGALYEWFRKFPLFEGQLRVVPPFHIPIQRRLQTLVVAWHTTAFLYFLVITLFMIANPFLWWIVLPYILYYFIDKTSVNGNVTKRYSKMFRSLALWKYYSNYFPIKLYKMIDLEPTFTAVEDNNEDGYSGNSFRLWPFGYVIRFRLKRLKKKTVVTGPRYIFGYHPHGIAALGVFGAIATEGCGWSDLFPGIPVCVCTLTSQFQIPLYRDYLLSFGCTSVSKKNVMKVLDQDYSVAIVIGGAQESLLSKFGSAELILEKRKGFIKLALETGKVSLVPIYAFGETDCFNTLYAGKDTYLRRIQMWVKKNYGFTVPIFFARGIFNYDFGLLPFRTPLNVVVGNPIYVGPKRSNPSILEINHYHSLYVSELKRIFDTYKARFGYGEKELVCVE